MRLGPPSPRSIPPCARSLPARSAVAILCAALAAAGCGGGGGGPDTTRPTVTGQTPAPNATDVALDATISATFSEAMNTATTNGALIVAYQGGPRSGEELTGSWATTPTTVTFTPDAPLAPSQQYQARVRGEAADLASNTMGSPSYWSFTTVAPATHTLDVSVTGPDGCGIGFGSASPGTPCAGSQCMQYEAGAVVTLIPNCTTVGDGISSWGGACAGAPVDGNCVVTLDGDKIATANFLPLTRRVTLTYAGAGSGTVSLSTLGTSCGLGCWTYPYGEALTLTPNPDASSDFAGFSGDCSGGSCLLTMGSDHAVNAQFNLKTFSISFSAGAHGSYTATAGGSSCGTDCRVYAYGTSVTVDAYPDTGYTAAWSGLCAAASGNSCSFTASAAGTVGLAFNPIPYDVALTVGSNGSVAPSPAGTSCGAGCLTYDFGTSVTFTATPVTGYHVAGWSGACSGTGTACNFTVTGAATVGVTFAVDTFPVTATKAGNGAAKGSVAFFPGGISCGAGCMTYDYGTSVTLVADVATGATFTGWSGAGCSGTGDCVVSVTSAQSVTATFTLDRHDLTVTKPGAGTGNVTSSPAGITCGSTCTATYDYETSVTLTATPGIGSTFAGWSGGGCSGVGTCTVTVTQATTVTAQFDKARYDVAVTKAGSGGGTIAFTPAGTSCGVDCQTYDYGTPVTLAATPDGASAFTLWSGSGCTGTGICAVTVDGAKSVNATFQAKRTIGVAVSHLLANGLVLRNNGGNDLTLNAGDTSGTFTTQIPDGGAYAVTVFTQPPGGRQWCSASGTSSGTVASDVTVQIDCTNLVVATYAAAPMWNDYVKAGSPAVACDGTETGGYSACLHGGERRSVQTLDQSSCTNLVAADALGAFDWSCDGSTNPVTFRSTSLKAAKKLSDLIKWTAPIGFTPNSVTVTDTSTSAVVFTSPSSVWWTNAFAADNFVTPVDGLIKVFTTYTRFSGSYTGGSGWSFVVKPGVYIDRPISGGINGSLLTLGGDFIWWEGDIRSADGPATLLEIQASRFAVVRGATFYVSSAGTSVGTLRVTNTVNSDFSGVSTNAAYYPGVGIEVLGGGSNVLHDLLSQGSVAAVEVTASTGNRAWNVETRGGAGVSIVGGTATRNAFSHFVVANAAGTGVSIQGGSDNVFTDFVMAGMARGIWAYGVSAASNAIGHFTIANTTAAGIQLGTAAGTVSFDRFTFFDVVSANSTGAGFSADAAAPNVSLRNGRIHDLVSAHNGAGVVLNRADNNAFDGVLKVGANGIDCSVTGGTSPGLDGTCASGATLTTGIGLGGSLVGTVTTDDAVNPDDTSGMIPVFQPSTSWRFENAFRTLGIYGSAVMFPDAAIRGAALQGASAQIYDWSLYAVDPVMRNVDAPAATAGTVITHTWADASTTSFLSGAIEVMGDGIGDDDGLCESNETCLYAPNVGAYQGHGTYGDVAVIDNGAVVNVTLKGYGTNGY